MVKNDRMLDLVVKLTSLLLQVKVCDLIICDATGEKGT